MANRVWQQQITGARAISRIGPKYPPSSQHQVETGYWDLLAAGRHLLVDNLPFWEAQSQVIQVLTPTGFLLGAPIQVLALLSQVVPPARQCKSQTKNFP